MPKMLDLKINLNLEPEFIEAMNKLGEALATASLSTSVIREDGINLMSAKAKAVSDITASVRMEVTAPGVATFVETSMARVSTRIQDLLYADDKPRGSFRNGAFRSMSIGTVVIATFRVSLVSGRRTLISVAPASDFESAIEEERAKITSELDLGPSRVKTVTVSGVSYDGFEVPSGSIHPPQIERLEIEDDDVLGATSDQPFSSDFLSSFFVTPDVMRTFTAAKRLLNAKESSAVKIMLAGQSGYGKTSIAEGFARSNGLSFLRLNCAAIRDPEEWFGYREAKDGSTVFVPNQLTEALREGNYVICFDEYNRIEPDIHNTLFPLLDHEGRTVVHGETIAVTKRVVFIATVNLGHQYTGTYQLDEAIINRFQLFVEVSELPPDEETKVLMERERLKLADAKKIVTICNRIRTAVPLLHCSVRTSLDIASQVAVSIPIKEAFLNCLQYRASDGVGGSLNLRKELIDILNTA